MAYGLASSFYIYEVAGVLTLNYGQAFVLRGCAAHAKDLKSKSPLAKLKYAQKKLS